MENLFSRRNWIKLSGMGFSGIFIHGLFRNIVIGLPKKDLAILLVSGWQDINVGDIAHTQELLNVFEIFLPEPG